MRVLCLFFLFFAFPHVKCYDAIRYCHGDPSFQNNKKVGFSLLQVQLLHRHGDRTPVHNLPQFLENVSWNCSDSVFEDVEESDSLKLRKVYIEGRQALHGTCMLGQLTNRGERQLKTLGQNFRELYVDTLHFLPAEVDSSVMRLRSTDVPRTIRSAYHFISGLYPNSGETLDLNVVERAMDNAFPNKDFCPYLAKAMKDIKASKAYVDYYKRHMEPLEKKYSELWKFPVDLTVLDDSLRARYCHKFEIPPLMEESDAHSVMHGVSRLENMIQDSFEVQQLSMGSFFGDMLRNMQEIPRPKFVLFSNHDSTLRAVLSAFNVFDAEWPAYASHIAIELWEELATGKHYVTVQYDGTVHKLKEPCKDYFCYYGDFVQLLNSFRTELCDEPSGSLNLGLEDLAPKPRLKPDVLMDDERQ